MIRCATLRLDEAVRTPWQAIVIGAGPAGALVARQLAVAGVATLLVERKAFPRAKVCGACLNTRAISTLSSLGLQAVLDDPSYVALREVQLRCGGRQAILPLPDGAALRRPSLDAALVRQGIAQGVQFLPETSALVLPACAGNRLREVMLRQTGVSGTAVARVVAVADGLGHPSLRGDDRFASHSSPGSRIGIGALFHASKDWPTGAIHMAVGRGGYAGVVRLADGSLNVAASIDPPFLRQSGGPAEAVARILNACEFPTLAELPIDGWQGTAALTQSVYRPAGHRLLVVGDAAGYVEPFTGEGIGLALVSAVAAAPLLIEGVRHWGSTIEQTWIATHQRLSVESRLLCRRLAWLLRHPWLMAAALSFVSRFPLVANRMVQRLNASHLRA